MIVSAFWCGTHFESERFRVASRDSFGNKTTIRIYNELASWWPMVSPPTHYVDEATDLLPTLMHAADAKPRTLIELGCGGGSLAFHFKAHLQLTLSDISALMLEQSRRTNPLGPQTHAAPTRRK